MKKKKLLELVKMPSNFVCVNFVNVVVYFHRVNSNSNNIKHKYIPPTFIRIFHQFFFHSNVVKPSNTFHSNYTFLHAISFAYQS